MVNQKDKERKEHVAHIIEIPDEYRLVVDDQEGVDDPYHLLWWRHKDDEENQIQITFKRQMKNIKKLLIVVGKFVILMLKLGERFGVSKIKRVIFQRI